MPNCNKAVSAVLHYIESGGGGGGALPEIFAKCARAFASRTMCTAVISKVNQLLLAHSISTIIVSQIVILRNKMLIFCEICERFCENALENGKFADSY